jgi:hypothetical protein
MELFLESFKLLPLFLVKLNGVVDAMNSDAELRTDFINADVIAFLSERSYSICNPLSFFDKLASA